MPTVAFLVSLFITATSMAQVEVVIVPPSTPAIAGETTQINLYFTNASLEDVTLQVPLSLAATLVRGDASSPIMLRLADAASAQRITLGVQGFRKIAYHTHLPSTTLAGPAALHVNGWRANTPYVMVVSSRAHTAQADGVRTAKAKPAVPGGDAASREPEATEGKNIFLDNISAYKPVYFLYGAAPSDAKFQISFKYRFLNAEGTLGQQWPWLLGLHFAYTQTSFWDLAAESLPFDDTNFKPELFYLLEDMALPFLPRRSRFDFQFGFQHESNGRAGDDSRRLNIGYIRPQVVFDIFDDYELSLAAQAWFYVGDLSDNATIKEFRGWSSFSASLGTREGFLLASEVRGNPSTGKGSLQVDFTYPLSKVLFRNLDFYLYAQFFTGYGESLLEFDEKDTRIRLGVGIVR
jgi:outer membrane phospholipase A